MILARQLDIPSLPKFLEHNFIKSDTKLNIGPIRDFKETSGIIKKSTPATKYSITKQIQKWLDENIKKSYHRAVIMKCQTLNASDTFSCHTDITREWALIYYYKTGGTNTVLNYYRENGYELIRGLDKRCNDYSKLKKIASFYPKETEWWLVRTDVLHDVKKMNSDRITLQLSYWSETVKELLI